MMSWRERWQNIPIETMQRIYIISYLAFGVLSWLRYYLVNTLKVDEVGFESLSSWFISFSLVAIVIMHFVSFQRIYPSDQLPVRKIAHLINLASIAILPCISNDIFSFLAYGDSFDYSDLIYRNSIDPNTYIYPYLSQLYTSTPNVYGLVSLYIAKVSASMGNLWMAIFSLKIICFAIVAIAIECLHRIDVKNSVKAFVILNPIWTIQALGQSHTEVISMSILFIAIYFLYHQKLMLSALFFTISIFAKLSMAICLPVLMYIIYQKQGSKRLIQYCVYQFSSLILGFGLVYWQFNNFDSILLPLTTIGNLWPTGSFAAYIDAIYQSNYTLIAMKLVFIAYTFVLFSKFKSDLQSNIPKLIFCLLMAFLLIYSHRFLTWYMILVLPVILIFEKMKYWNWFMILGLGLTIQDCAHFNHSEPIYIVIVGVGIAITILSQIKILVLPFEKSA